MLATECSKPPSTNAMIGNQIAKTLPIVCFEEAAARIARHTSMLQRMPEQTAAPGARAALPAATLIV